MRSDMGVSEGFECKRMSYVNADPKSFVEKTMWHYTSMLRQV